VVLAAFLLFAGIGSGLAPHLDARLRRNGLDPIAVAAGGIVAVAAIYLAALPSLLAALIAVPDVARAAIAIVLIAPLAFCMGLPFPLALARVREHRPALVPWAWGVNGCASVLSAVLAGLLAMSFGFTAVVALAALLYTLAALLLRAPLPPAAPV
jgi:hypothetical protein